MNYSTPIVRSLIVACFFLSNWSQAEPAGAQQSTYQQLESRIAENTEKAKSDEAKQKEAAASGKPVADETGTLLTAQQWKDRVDQRAAQIVLDQDAAGKALEAWKSGGEFSVDIAGTDGNPNAKMKVSAENIQKYSQLYADGKMTEAEMKAVNPTVNYNNADYTYSGSVNGNHTFSNTAADGTVRTISFNDADGMGGKDGMFTEPALASNTTSAKTTTTTSTTPTLSFMPVSNCPGGSCNRQIFRFLPQVPKR